MKKYFVIKSKVDGSYYLESNPDSLGCKTVVSLGHATCFFKKQTAIEVLENEVNLLSDFGIVYVEETITEEWV